MHNLDYFKGRKYGSTRYPNNCQDEELFEKKNKGG